MNFSSSELKRRARSALTGKYGTMIGAGFLVSAISGGLSLLLTLFGDGSLSYQICFLIITFLTTILSAGLSFLTLNIARGRDVRATDVFAVFSNHPDRIIILTLLLELISIACLLPLMLSSAFLVFSITGLFAFPKTGTLLLIAAACIVSLVLLIIVTLRYSLVYFLYFDYPSLSATELMRESSRRMKGKKGRYFYLQISFIGMHLLAILSLGLGYLWLLPYISMAQTFFYLETFGETRSNY